MPEAVKDPYQVLNLKPGSSDEEVRQQYRRLARVYHPDRNPGDSAWCEEQLTELNIAFDVLSNPARKAALDARARAANDAEFQRQAKQSTFQTATPPVDNVSPGPAEVKVSPQETKSIQTADTAPIQPDARLVHRKRNAGGAWVIFAVMAGISGVAGWNRYAPVSPAPLKAITAGTHETVRAAGSGMAAGNKHAPSVTPAAPRGSGKTHGSGKTRESTKTRKFAKAHYALKPGHAVHQALAPRHNPTVRIPNHFRSLSPSQKSSVALQLAEAAEARGRASMARQLRQRGINTHGLNYSQMRKLSSQ